MYKIFQILLICLLYMQPTLADKTDILIIDPTLSNIDSIPRLSRDIKIHLGKIIDNTPSQATGIIGKTRVGIKSFAPIILKPPLVESLRKSFTSVLQQRGNLAADASVATYVLDLTISDCTIIENSALFSQTLTAFLKMEARLTNPLEADKVHSFTVESQTSTKSMDTSKYAMGTLRDALINVISEIIKTTNKF